MKRTVEADEGGSGQVEEEEEGTMEKGSKGKAPTLRGSAARNIGGSYSQGVSDVYLSLQKRKRSSGTLEMGGEKGR